MVNDSEKNRAALTFAMRLSLVIGILMFVMKMGAYLLTGSTAILSDAAESVVHVAAVAFATYSLKLSYRPADETHLYGHAKISFFSAGFEGAMIVFAAVYIIYEAVHEWMTGLHLENLGQGTAITALAAVINGGLGAYLLWLGKKRKSLILEANGKHVMTDCWTSLGVLVGLTFTLVTGWLPWDPIFAILVAVNILFSGFGLIRKSVTGLMDGADPRVHQQLIDILDRETKKHKVLYHHVLHRDLGETHWVELHLLFPESTSIKDAHRTATDIEKVIERNIEPTARVTSHLEAIEDHHEVHVDKHRI
jgi:cation diffusion facilitator family transporter